MTIRTDPENNEPNALFALADFNGRRVLEIGCGDGRLTWRYADKAAHVTAIEPNPEQVAIARRICQIIYKAGLNFMQLDLKTLPLTANLRYSIS